MTRRVVTRTLCGAAAVVAASVGVVALARLTPDGMTVLARAPLFEAVAWTVLTLVGTTLYARDREKIVALDLGAD